MRGVEQLETRDVGIIGLLESRPVCYQPANAAGSAVPASLIDNG
jgi:hypothetical protein